MKTANHIAIDNLSAEARAKFNAYIQAADTLAVMAGIASDAEYLTQKAACEKLYNAWQASSDSLSLLVTPDYSTGDYQSDA